MKKCKACKHEVADDAKHCSECGRKLGEPEGSVLSEKRVREIAREEARKAHDDTEEI